MKNLLFLIVPLVLLNCAKDEENSASPPASAFVRLDAGTDNGITDLWFINNDQGVLCGTFGQFSKTNDGGQNWITLDVGLDHSFISTFMLDANTFYTGRLGVYGTQDAGTSFQELGNLSDFSDSVFAIHFFDENIGIIIKGRLILRTVDGGNNWEVAYNGAQFLSGLQITSSTVGYVAGGITYDGFSDGEMHKTLDRGCTWINLKLSTSQVTAFNFIDDDIGYYVNYDRELYKTVNGGENWTKISENLNGFVTDLLFLDELIAYYTTAEGSIYSTTNGGTSWTIAYNDTNFYLYKIKRFYNAIYATGNDGLILKMVL